MNLGSRAGQPVLETSLTSTVDDSSTPLISQPDLTGPTELGVTNLPLRNALTSQDMRSTIPEPLHPQLGQIQRDVHAQILNALINEDDVRRDYRRNREDKEQDLRAPQKSIASADMFAQKLHDVVDAMLRHLKTKEETVYRSARTYAKSGLDCVEKIEQKRSREQHVLAETWRSDGDKFIQILDGVRREVHTTGRKREEELKRLEEKNAARRMLFQKAKTSLRALHGRLLEANSVEDGGLERAIIQ
ncbi:hypothetical protein BGZ63DRAFT_423008 [Mariannaea sp. PMI_226]|nr:hypothetical protein BGZ63DRAFT_423008 [Mariannaea sp. PMI_226]